MMNSASPLLEMKAVSQMYGSIVALRQITLEIQEGEFLSVIGPSGSGKTTLLKIMAGVILPSHGEVRFRGKPIATFSPAEHGVLMMWQSLALFPHLNVADNVGFGLAIRKIDATIRKRRVSEALALVELSGFEKRAVHTLSGGEQQRVALARALVLKPAVLLLDEPLQGLDRHLRSRLIGTIRQLHRQLRLTLVMVTHEQSEALLLGTRLVVMRRGCIEQSGTPDAVLLRPSTRFVAEFVGNRNVFSGRVVEVQRTTVTVNTSLGNLKAIFPSWINYRPNAGDEVVYVIDAHNMHVGNGGDNNISAVIEAIVGDGISELIEFAGSDVGIVKCHRSKTFGAEHLIAGSAVSLSWHSADAYILSAE